MELRDSVDQSITVEGYVSEITDEGVEVSIQTSFGYGAHPFQVPENYRMVTMHDMYGNEWYIIAPNDMEVKND